MGIIHIIITAYQGQPQTVCLTSPTRASVAPAAQAQLAATPAPPWPEFSTATNPPAAFTAEMLKPSLLIGRSVFQLSKPSADSIERACPKRALVTA